MSPSSSLFVVIMAGGGGTRLWPQSRRLRPKQYLPLLPGGETLLAATVHRVAPLCPIERVLIVTTAEQVPQVRRCLPTLPIDNILVEPLGRNTAPCIGLAALWARRKNPEAVLAVLPADHYIQDQEAFVQVLRKAVAVAEKGHIATIGIRPTRPETGYGYIQLGPKGEDDAYVVERFIEKPDLAHAEAYLRAGTYLWNAGTFFFPAARILNELATHQTQLMTLLLELEQNPEHLAARYGEAPSISIDYAVMERLPPKTLRVLPGDFGWNDVGSFAALSDLHPKDEAHNVALASEGGAAKTVFVDAHRNIVWSNTKQLVSTAFVSDLIVVATEDAILILPRERAQDVKQVVETLNKSKRSEYL